MKTIQELIKEGKYIYRYKKIVFEGGNVPTTPQREENYPDKFDSVFESKEEFNEWYKKLVSGLAELDGAMNYCKFFKRVKGNDGLYIREGKCCKVNGQWTRYYIEATGNLPKEGWYEGLKNFQCFLDKNNWRSNYFELMEKYI